MWPMLRIKRPIFARRYLTTADFVHSLQVSAGHERRWKYVYDEFYDCVICPEYQPLKYRITNRDGYREYKSDQKICANCPIGELCTNSKGCVKAVQRHIRKDYDELAEHIGYTPEHRIGI